MKHLTLGLVAAAMLASAAQAQQSVTIATTTTEDSHYGVGAEAFITKLEELSGGEWTGQQAPSGVLGGERDLIEGAQIGSVDMVITSTGPLGNFVPEVFVLDLPFLFRDYDHARKVLDGEIGDELLAKVDEQNLVGLAWTENGFRHVTNNVRPIKTPEDLAGLKLRTMENKVHMAAFEDMGAAPTPMAFPELFSALQQGVVDGEENPIVVINASKFYEVQKYLSLTGHVYSPAIMLASPALWDGLSDEEKGWFREAAKVGVAATRAKVTELEEQGVALLREEGMEVETDIVKEPFRVLAEKAYSVYTDEYGTEMVDRIKAVE